jgi:hypothetical protein
MLFQVKLHNTDQISKKDFLSIILGMQSHFADWSFKDMGGLSAIKDSIHYHVSSNDKTITGTLEITFDPSLKNVITLKIAKNRLSDWSMKALDEIVKFLEIYIPKNV